MSCYIFLADALINIPFDDSFGSVHILDISGAIMMSCTPWPFMHVSVGRVLSRWLNVAPLSRN